MAAVFYATLYPSYGRTVKNLFLREDFAIPLILLALVFTVRAMQRGSDVSSNRDAGKDRRDVCPTFQILAALFWLAALASWHLTQFVMAVLVGAVALVFLMRGEIPRVPWSVVVLAAGGVLIPVLRAKEFYLSPSMCVLYGLTLTAWIDGSRRKQLAVFFGATAVCVLLGALLQKSYGEYAHVYQLFFYKLRFLGVKPDSPSRLPWEARTLWEGAFNSADWTEPWHSLQWCFPLSLAAVWMTRHEKDASVRVWVVFALLLFLLGAMVLRFFTFVGFAAAVMAAGLWVQRRVWSTLAVPAAIVWQVATLNFEPLERTPVVPQDYKQVVHWLNENTPTNAVILAHISEAPVFWAHTGRPIILHSKFENRAIRERFREFLDAVYGSEEKFHEFCKKNGADYFVYDPGFMLLATDSRRYKADKIGDLDENCVVMLFADHPERLRLFAQEFLEGKFRVFRVLP